MLAAIVVAAIFVIILTVMAPIVTQMAAKNAPDGTITVIQSESVQTDPEFLTASAEVSGHEATEAGDDSNNSYWEALTTTTSSPYANPTQSTALYLNVSRPLVGEHIGSSSALVDEPINEIEVSIRKVGNPNEPAKVGVFHANYSTIQKVSQVGSNTSAASTSDGVPSLIVNNGDVTVNVEGGESYGERANSKQSILYQYPVTSISSVRLAKTGSPTGDVIIGIMDETTGEPVRTCATVSVSSLSTSSFASFGGSCAEYYVQLGEVVGIYFDGTGTVAGGNYVRLRVSTSESFDHTEDDVRTSFAEFTGGSWVPDATKDMKQTITGATRIAFSAIDTDLVTYWQNNNPAALTGSNSTSGILDYSLLVGANFDGPVLKSKYNDGQVPARDLSFYVSHFQAMRDHHFTVARVPYSWEAYEVNSANFLLEAERIAQAAQQTGMRVFFDNHHYDISSRVVSGGSGFPEFVVTEYDAEIVCYEVPPPNNCATDDAERFWDDFWTNDVDYNGTNVWQDMANFEKTLINRVDSYDSVIGYEILNEPHIWQASHYAQMGDFYDFMYHELREVTTKDLHMTIETPHGVDDGGNEVQRSPGERWKIFPDNDGTIYGIVWQPHHYNHNSMQSQINGLVVKTLQDLMDPAKGDYDPEMISGVLFGEFGMGGSSNVCAGNGNAPTTDCQDGMDQYIEKLSNPVTITVGSKTLELNSLGWTYWKWNNLSGGSASQGRVLTQVDGDDEPNNPYMSLRAMDSSLADFYDLDQLDAVAENTGGTGGSTGGATTDNIYLNFTDARTVSSVKIKHQNADFVPDSVKLYFTNDTANWGTAAETASLAANTNNQTITVSPTKTAKYMKVEPGVFSNARFWRVQNIDAGQVPPHPVITNTTTLEIIPIKVFGTIQPDVLTTSFQNITRSLIGANYTLQDGDYVGVHYSENVTGANYVEVKIDTTDHFDGSNTRLVYALSNATTFQNGQDLSGNFKLTRLVDPPEIIADMGANATVIDKVTVYKPNANNIPVTVDIAVANTYDSETGEPIFTTVLSDYGLTQSVGTETIDIPNTAGRFVKVAVNSQGDIDSIRLGELDAFMIGEVEVQVPDQWAQGYDQIVTSFYVAMGLAVVGLVVYLIKQGTE